jgi:GNAT superfamily N-acetyltransferase
MVLVKNSYIYWEFVRNLRNLDGVREGFIEQDIIDPEEHQEYMKKYSDCFYICLVGEIPAGYVGVIQDDIRVATHPSFQGQGVGKFMINQIMEIYPDAKAKIKITNEKSTKLFKSCGFSEKFIVLEKTRY